MPVSNELIIDADTLAKALSSGDSAPVILDVRPSAERESGYISLSQHLAPERLNRSEKPLNGLLPTPEEVQKWTEEFNIQPTTWVVVYDGGRSTTAARALWVLHAYGFTHVSWLNGGIPIWLQNGHPLVTRDSSEQDNPSETQHPANTVPADSQHLALTPDPNVVVSKETLQQLFADASAEHPAPQPVDARSAAEFAGTDVRSARGGHMPGAVHFEWLDLFQNDGRLKPDDQLRQALDHRSIRDDQPCVVYCQSHQRSAVTYLALKHLGYTSVAALDGAWSNWGNDPDTPIEL